MLLHMRCFILVTSLNFLTKVLLILFQIIFEETLLGGGIQLHCCALAIRVQDVAMKIMCQEKIGFV